MRRPHPGRRIRLNASEPKLPDATIETLARGFFKEASAYGFSKMDYVRFVNVLLDTAMTNHNGNHHPVRAHDEVRESESTPGFLSLPLRGDRIIIRAFDGKNDMELVDSWLHENTGRYFLLSLSSSRIMSIEEFFGDRRCIGGTIVQNDSTPIGILAFINYDQHQSKAELRKLIGDTAARGMGYGKEATTLWIEYGRRGLGLKKIYLRTLETNIRNIRLNEELGFRIEGILRNEVYFDGVYHDLLRMGLWFDS